MPTLKIQRTKDVAVPKGTKVIANDDWITLARKVNGNIWLFTCESEFIDQYDLFEDGTWMQFTKSEIEEISKIR